MVEESKNENSEPETEVEKPSSSVESKEDVPETKNDNAETKNEETGLENENIESESSDSESNNSDTELEDHQKEFTFKHQFEFENKDEWLTSPDATTTAIPTIKFWIKAQTKANNTIVNIQIGKNSLVKTVAIVNVRVVDSIRKTRRVVDWINYVDFENFLVPISIEADRKITPKLKVTIHCSVRWHGVVEDLYYPDMCAHMNSYYKNREFSDMVIKVGEIEFPAHKIIVASQSPVFHRMLTSDLLEAKQNSITFSDTETDWMEDLLLFFYKGKLNKAEENYKIALKLFKFADMYQIKKLKTTCEYILIKNLTVDNAFIIHTEGKTCGSTMLQQHVIAFIHLNSTDMYNAIM